MRPAGLTLGSLGLELLITWKDFSIPMWYFANEQIIDSQDNFSYELHAFSDSSIETYVCVVYLRRIMYGVSSTSFVFGKCRIVQCNQQTWAIARKELIATVMSRELTNNTCNALQQKSIFGVISELHSNGLQIMTNKC